MLLIVARCDTPVTGLYGTVDWVGLFRSLMQSVDPVFFSRVVSWAREISGVPADESAVAQSAGNNCKGSPDNNRWVAAKEPCVLGPLRDASCVRPCAPQFCSRSHSSAQPGSVSSKDPTRDHSQQHCWRQSSAWSHRPCDWAPIG